MDDRWDDEPYDDAAGGVLWRTLRNVGAVIAMCLAVAWAVSGFVGGADAPARPLAQALQQAAMPPQPMASGDYELSIPAGDNGHFMVNAMANGSPVRFLVDTGASGVLLGEADARRVGISTASLDFDTRVQTANGDIPVARATLREIRIAGLIVNDLEVWITRSPMPVGLLGMSFLKRLASYEAKNDRLVLRW